MSLLKVPLIVLLVALIMALLKVPLKVLFSNFSRKSLYWDYVIFPTSLNTHFVKMVRPVDVLLLIVALIVSFS